MRIFYQNTKDGETITWYGFGSKDRTECLQHILFTKWLLENPVAFDAGDGTLQICYDGAVNTYVNLKK